MILLYNAIRSGYGARKEGKLGGVRATSDGFDWFNPL